MRDIKYSTIQMGEVDFNIMCTNLNVLARTKKIIKVNYVNSKRIKLLISIEHATAFDSSLSLFVPTN